MKFSPMAIPAMALMQQHEARRDILIKPAARRRTAIEAWGHSELGVGRSELGAQAGRKNPPACTLFSFVLVVLLFTSLIFIF